MGQLIVVSFGWALITRHVKIKQTPINRKLQTSFPDKKKQFDLTGYKTIYLKLEK